MSEFCCFLCENRSDIQKNNAFIGVLYNLSGKTKDGGPLGFDNHDRSRSRSDLCFANIQP